MMLGVIFQIISAIVIPLVAIIILIVVVVKKYTSQNEQDNYDATKQREFVQDIESKNISCRMSDDDVKYLRQIKALYDMGALTLEEYENKKKAILDRK